MSLRAERLGKYQLIEKVGQGGMAVVYRGLDSSLNREVAIKILHRHLVENREAQTRFGREAHAVAKLRHENILEIYDFFGGESTESYIVTEFINGCTLREFCRDHTIRFAELGAMITVQVCRALAHAHSLGVLHRDVKPENIMIRDDGVIKLTDFGISQMVDLRRMTATGQLMGSPAYMSPEHVRGGNLDFRTDVFAVGTILYELATGELPFQGKNQHEILKRIADCIYIAPDRVTPKVGTELSRIIQTALACDPEERYASIHLMQQELEAYLEASGIQEPKRELQQFFASSTPYQNTLKKRLISHLTCRGKSLAASGSYGALESFNRVLAIDENNPEVLKHLRHWETRKRNYRIAWLGASLVLLAVLSVIANNKFSTDTTAPLSLNSDNDTPHDATVPILSSDMIEKRMAETIPLISVDAAPKSVPPHIPNPPPPLRKRKPDTIGSKPLAPSTRDYQLKLSPRGSEYRVDDGPWKLLTTDRINLELPNHARTLSARNPECCQEVRVDLSSDKHRSHIDLPYLPAQITPTCSQANVQVKIDDKNARLNRGATIPITRLTGTEIVVVEFISDNKIDTQSITVKATSHVDVPCKF